MPLVWSPALAGCLWLAIVSPAAAQQPKPSPPQRDSTASAWGRRDSLGRVDVVERCPVMPVVRADSTARDPMPTVRADSGPGSRMPALAPCRPSPADTGKRGKR